MSLSYSNERSLAREVTLPSLPEAHAYGRALREEAGDDAPHPIALAAHAGEEFAFATHTGHVAYLTRLHGKTTIFLPDDLGDLSRANVAMGAVLVSAAILDPCPPLTMIESMKTFAERAGDLVANTAMAMAWGWLGMELHELIGEPV